eukprot:TRINITY_DN2255_c0_g1_i1.p1 TRINITY_DN2255_c0_g1~~TRINITY_DN2255_c0_g1_i1.p1  ORF type:complete len:222 (-),score=-11.77 TRINITY_DN2255_c0_g1_i1:163-828(-)
MDSQSVLGIDTEYFREFLGNNMDLPLSMTFPPLNANGLNEPCPQSPLLRAAPSKRKIKVESEDSEYEDEPSYDTPALRRSARQKKKDAKTTKPAQKKRKTKAKGKDKASDPEKGVDAKLIAKEKEGTLTTAEAATLKKQRRLAKNRTAAAQFRQRQKEYIANLEQRVEELGKGDMERKYRLAHLESENQVLREQVASMRAWMDRCVTFSAAAPAPPALVSL